VPIDGDVLSAERVTALRESAVEGVGHASVLGSVVGRGLLKVEEVCGPIQNWIGIGAAGGMTVEKVFDLRKEETDLEVDYATTNSNR